MKNAYRLLSLLTCLWIVCCATSLVQAKANPPLVIRYVKPVATGTGDGFSWANASGDLQAMIDASQPGHEVWVAAGTYKPSAYPAGCANCSSPKDYTFLLKNGVKLYGGFAGTTETSISERNLTLNETILSGEIGDQNINTDNCYHVVLSSNDDATTLIDGFTITGGYGYNNDDHIFYDNNYMYQGSGTGLYLNMSRTTVNNIVFKNNYSYYGALAIEYDNFYDSDLPFAASSTTRVKGQKTKTAPVKRSKTQTPPARKTKVPRTAGMPIATSITGGVAVSNCTFEDNFGYYGGAVELEYTEDVSFTNCSFKSNHSDGYGGAVYTYSDVNISFDGCTFEKNKGDYTYGGAIYFGEPTDLIIKNSSFKNNQATGGYEGGALYFDYYYGDVNIENCVFEENEASDGGAIYTYYGSDSESGKFIIDRCVFKRNKASDPDDEYSGSGGAIASYDCYEFVIKNSLFDGNIAEGSGIYGGGNAGIGSVFYAAYTTLTMTNCTIVNNSAPNGTGVISGYDYDYYELGTPTIINCIFWGNTDNGTDADRTIISTDDSEMFDISYTNIQGGVPSLGTDKGNNTNTDPQFVDAANGNFRLRTSSPLVNAGSNAVASSLDLDGNQRIADVTVDMGAYENQCVGAGLPTALSVTGGGDVCPGSNGVAVGLASSQSGVNYQLYRNNNAVGNAQSGTGNALNFGNQTAAGTYTVIGTKVSTGCTSNMSGTATVTAITPVGGTASADQTICTGTAPSNITLSGNVGNVTKWQRATNANFSGASDITVTNTTLMGSTIGNLSTDTWFRAVVQASSCPSVNSSAVKITVLQPISASISGNNVACTGTTLSLSASPSGNGLGYSWSGPGNFSSNLSNPTRNNLTTAMSGIYRLAVARPACGFTSTASISVVITAASGKAVPRLKALLVNGSPAGVGNTYSVCSGAPVTALIAAISGTSYSWNGPNNTSGVGSLAATAPTPTISNAANAGTAGNYTLRIFNGCDRSTTVNFSITLRNCSSGRLAADEASLGLDISLAPNPVRDVLDVNLKGIEGPSLQLGIHDAQGRAVQQVSIEAAEGKAQHRFDLRSLPAGMYLLQAETNSQRATKKVIKVD